MGNVEKALTDARTAVEELIVAAEAAHEHWTIPVGPGKWTPSQISEHVAYTLEEAAKVAGDQASSFPKIPFLVQPVLRMLVFDRVLRNGRAPKAKTFTPFNPQTGPETPAAARERLTDAMNTFDARCMARNASGASPVDFPVFGKVSLENFVSFQALHTRHHEAQIPAA